MLCYVIHGLNSCMANKDTAFYLPCFLFNKCSFGMINFVNLYYYLAYFCCYSYVSLYFFVLFMSLTILFQLTFTFIYSTFCKKFSVLTK